MAKQMETILKADMKPEVEEIVKLLDEFPEEGREKFLIFLQGAVFATGTKEPEMAG